MKIGRLFKGPPMAIARCGFSTAVSELGIFVFGGYANGSCLSSCEFYDKLNNRYIKLFKRGLKCHFYSELNSCNIMWIVF